MNENYKANGKEIWWVYFPSNTVKSPFSYPDSILSIKLFSQLMPTDLVNCSVLWSNEDLNGWKFNNTQLYSLNTKLKDTLCSLLLNQKHWKEDEGLCP